MHNETNLLRQAGTLREKVKVYSHRGGERFWESILQSSLINIL